jgi:hypothetical protein
MLAVTSPADDICDRNLDDRIAKFLGLVRVAPAANSTMANSSQPRRASVPRSLSVS